MNGETQREPLFSSRFGMILTCMGMAVGTGNIWRFPREVAGNGGGSFLIPWIIFLFLWSIPLLMVELAMGKNTRRGPFGAFAKLLGDHMAPLGGFISICAMLIMCYYAVVTGWTFRYVVYAFAGTLNSVSESQAIALFDGFRSTWLALGFHWLAVAVAALVVFKGTRGIERLNKILIPMLIAILLIGAVRSLMLVGSGDGLDYLFTVEWERLAKPSHWLAGLTQSAWSTGAGWGLMLAYAVYARREDNTMVTPVATGLGNNSIEIIVALLIFPALFSIMGLGAVDYVSGSSSKGGIAFQIVPLLFQKIPGGGFFNILFFIGLASAALTSLIAMMELSCRFFMDFRMTRKKALVFTLLLCLVLGSLSALSDKIFDDQDFVWGVGLMISGLFLAVAVFQFGARDFYRRLIAPGSGGGRWFQIAMGLVLVEGSVLLGWWFYKGMNLYFKISSLIQWWLVIGVLFLLRRKLCRRMAGPDGDRETVTDG